MTLLAAKNVVNSEGQVNVDAHLRNEILTGRKGDTNAGSHAGSLSKKHSETTNTVAAATNLSSPLTIVLGKKKQENESSRRALKAWRQHAR